MALIRKTLSVATVGVVSFRSKKERLRRAERSQRHAEASLGEEHAARVAAEGRISGSKKQEKRASAQAAHAGRRLERSKQRRRHRQSETTRDVLAAVEPIVHSGIENVRGASMDAAERGRRAGRRARKAAAQSMRRAKEEAAPRLASVAARTADVIDDFAGPDE